MNAPATKTDLAASSAYQFLPLGAIEPSSTHIQQLRRARLDPAGMAEMIKSVSAHGVLQAILVRPLVERGSPAWPHGGVPTRCELVAGERRWLAARAAKLEHIPAVVRELTDVQVVEIQLIENLQRRDLHPLDEAEGFAELMHLKGVTAEAIAETIGRSRTHVFGRLKLLELIPAAREAFNTGKIDASKAQLIARIPLPKLQAKALKQAQALDWKQQPFSFREFKEWLDKDSNKFTVALGPAPFSQFDANLYPAAGSCRTCPKRTGNAADLFADVKDPDVCTDPECYNKKAAIHQKRLRVAAEEQGRTIIAGDAAKEIDRGHGMLRGYIGLDDSSDEAFDAPEPECGEDGLKTPEYIAWEQRADAFVPRTWRQILGAALDAKSVELLDTGKALREIVPIPIAKNLLKHHGITLPDWLDRKAPAADPAARREEEEKRLEREEREKAYRRALLAQIHAKWKPPLKHEDLVAIAFSALSDAGLGPALAELYGGEDLIDLPKMKDADIMRLLVELTVSEQADYMHLNPAPLLALAKRCRIDPAKVKKDLAKAEKAKDKPEASAPSTKKAAKTKPAKRTK
jgi:ParB/RepB/Spo0J family partition protein